MGGPGGGLFGAHGGVVGGGAANVTETGAQNMVAIKMRLIIFRFITVAISR
jgi:hypothetical protein